LLEVVIAIFIATVAVMAILGLQPAAWKTSARADYMGRAAGILHQELQRRELWIMNPCNAVTPGTTPAAVPVSGHTTVLPGDTGDMTFNVTTTISSLGTKIWRVTVTVAWPGHDGISESIMVTRQESFRFPSGCSDQ
jgi:Tfp pilus assembly protein PilV